MSPHHINSLFCRYSEPFGSLRWQFPFVLDMMRDTTRLTKLPAAFADGHPWGQKFTEYTNVQPGKYAPKQLLLRLVQLVTATSNLGFKANMEAAEPHSSECSQKALSSACNEAPMYADILSHASVSDPPAWVWIVSTMIPLTCGGSCISNFELLLHGFALDNALSANAHC